MCRLGSEDKAAYDSACDRMKIWRDSSDGNKLVASGVSWTVVGSLIKLFSTAIALGIVAHIAGPEVMGVFGVSWGWINLFYVVAQNGSAQSVIGIENLTVAQERAAVWSSVLVSLLGSSILVLMSRFASHIYPIRGISTGLLLGALVLPIMSLAAVDIALEQKRLGFKRLAMIQSIAVTASAFLSILLAYLGFKLLALVCLQGGIGLFTFISFRILREPWRLGRTSAADFASIWVFGRHLSLGSMTGALTDALPTLIMGFSIPAQAIGLYTFSYRIVQVCATQLSGSVGIVLYPYLSSVRTEDNVLAPTLRLVGPATTAVLLLPMAILAVMPSDILSLYAGGKWVEAGQILRWLAVAQMLYASGASVFATFSALNMPHNAWRWNLLVAGLQAIGLCICVRWGAVACAMSIAVTALITPLAVLWLSKYVQINRKIYFGKLSVIYFASIMAGVVGLSFRFLVGPHVAVGLLAVQVALIIVTYGTVLGGFVLLSGRLSRELP